MSTRLFKIRSSYDADVITNSTHIYERMIERSFNMRDLLWFFEKGEEYVFEEEDSGVEVMFRSHSRNQSVVFVANYNEEKEILELEMITCINKVAKVSPKEAANTHVYDLD
jgi:hypothetical protein